ncbi:AhpC/TSA family protein [Bacteroidales bacterium OttesenSCG-928-M06]|nr:AhpC/TSA family protein [Bacteroidales bacterium OttesenSCG-928-M06]
MKKAIIHRLLLFFSFCIFLFSCQNEKNFTISGKIIHGGNQTLYLEHVGVAKTTLLDSLVLQSEDFKFIQKRPDAPDFYRLRLGNQSINLAIDSTGNIRVNGDASTFATEYVLDENDEKNKNIQILTLMQIKAKKEYNDLVLLFDKGEISSDEFSDKAYAVINHYKNTAKEYISEDFKSPVAYFALFQQINNLLIFSPYNKEDSKLFGALANSWNIYYPESPRAIQLKNIYSSSKASFKEIDPLILNEADGKTLFDISLPSIDNKNVRMSEVCDGKVTIIDFTAYTMDASPVHNLLLSEIYNKYKGRGLEIYQVSLDSDEHIWKNAAVNLPWICVWDSNSYYSDIAVTYNVTDIPATFLMNKKGEIVFRVENYVDLEKEVIKYLK